VVCFGNFSHSIFKKRPLCLFFHKGLFLYMDTTDLSLWLLVAYSNAITSRLIQLYKNFIKTRGLANKISSLFPLRMKKVKNAFLEIMHRTKCSYELMIKINLTSILQSMVDNNKFLF